MDFQNVWFFGKLRPSSRRLANKSNTSIEGGKKVGGPKKKVTLLGKSRIWCYQLVIFSEVHLMVHSTVTGPRCIFPIKYVIRTFKKLRG